MALEPQVLGRRGIGQVLGVADGRRVLRLRRAQPCCDAWPLQEPPKRDPAGDRERQHTREIARGRCRDRADDGHAGGADENGPRRKEPSPQAPRREDECTADQQSNQRVRLVGGSVEPQQVEISVARLVARGGRRRADSGAPATRCTLLGRTPASITSTMSRDRLEQIQAVRLSRFLASPRASDPQRHAAFLLHPCLCPRTLGTRPPCAPRGWELARSTIPGTRGTHLLRSRAASSTRYAQWFFSSSSTGRQLSSFASLIRNELAAAVGSGVGFLSAITAPMSSVARKRP